MSGPISIKIPFKAGTIQERPDIQQLLARSFLYQALAFLFRHPSITGHISFEAESAHWIEALEVIELPQRVYLKNLFQKLTKDLQETSPLERIRQFEACFGHTAQGPVPDYELEYGEEHTHRQPQQLGDIAAFYNAFGLRSSETFHERVDHVSVECEFMHFLLLKEAYALQFDGQEKARICQDASRRFLSEHLGSWLPSLTVRLGRYARQGVMKTIADFAFLFIVQDCEQLGIAPGSEHLPIRPIQENEDSGCINCAQNPNSPS